MAIWIILATHSKLYSKRQILPTFLCSLIHEIITSKQGGILMSETKVNFMWQHRVDDYNASGQTVAIWCKENDIKPARLRSWIREFSTDRTATKKVANWVSVDATELKDVISEKSLIVKIGVASIEINSNFDKDLFSKVTEVLLSLC